MYDWSTEEWMDYTLNSLVKPARGDTRASSLPSSQEMWSRAEYRERTSLPAERRNEALGGVLVALQAGGTQRDPVC